MDNELRELFRQLEANGNRAMVRLTRLYIPHPKKIFEGEVEFFIQKHKNEVRLIAIKGMEWAEYCLESYEGNGKFVCEDYLMELI